MISPLQRIEEIERNAAQGKRYFESVLNATALLKKELSGGSDSSNLRSKRIAKDVVGKRMKSILKK